MNWKSVLDVVRKNPQEFFAQGGWKDMLAAPSDEEEDLAEIDDEDFEMEEDDFEVEEDDDVSYNRIIILSINSFLIINF